MRIEDEIKLTFDDVLIRPKRSTLISRSEVKLEREFKFRHNKHTWEGIPIFSANMDTTGTFETAKALQSHKMLTAIHKFYTLEDWKQKGVQQNCLSEKGYNQEKVSLFPQ